MEHLQKDVQGENIQLEVLKHPKKSALFHMHWFKLCKELMEWYQDFLRGLVIWNAGEN